MGLLPYLDMLALIRFCILTIPLMVGTSFNFPLLVCLETNAIDSETVGSCRKTPRGSRISPQNH
jgi:hypothetical protein